MNSKPLHAFRNSGASARNWKGRIALLAKRGSETMRTLQFPLDLTDEQRTALPLRELTVAYNTLEGTGPGTLYAYWAALHAAGFRFFPSGGVASLARQQAVFQDEAWNAAFCAQSGKDWAWLTPSALFARFSKAPREVAKRDGSRKDTAFSAENIANECHVSLCGTSLTDKTPEDIRSFLSGMGSVLAGRYESWKDANGDLPGVMSALDGYLSRLAASLPALADMAAKIGPTQPENATVAWLDAPVAPPAQIAPFIYARCATRYGKAPDSGLAKFVQSQATTANATALSWLFGKGMEYFRQASLDQIRADFEIPAEAAWTVEQVKAAALAVPAIGLFGKKNYSSFRAVFGGKIDSWIANYGSRLLTLNELLATFDVAELVLPAALLDNDNLMSGLEMNADELHELVQAVVSEKDAAQQAVTVLLGGTAGDVDAAVACFERFSGLLDALHGRLSYLAARVERSIEIAGSDEAAVEALLPCRFKIPAWCKPMPKLVGISGGVPDVAADVAAIAAEFNAVREKMRARYRMIFDWVATMDGNAYRDPYAQLAEVEKAHILRLNPQYRSTFRADAQARRKVLHRIARAVQNCSEATKQAFVAAVRDTEVFENAHHLNTFIFNQKGAIYRSPFDKARNMAYRLRITELLAVDWLAFADAFTQTLWQDGGKAAVEDALRIERTLMQIRLSCIPDIPYSSFLAQPDIDVEIHPSLALQFAKQTVTAEIVQKGFNLYSAKLSGLSFKLLRERFIVKLRFGLDEDTQLIYTPKDRDWIVPKQYLQDDGPLGDAARIVAERAEGQKPAAMVRALAEASPAAQGAFMRQAPHDWYFDASFGGSSVEGFTVTKGSVGRPRSLRGHRMIGAPSFKSVLDKSLVGLADIGRASVIIEQPYQQSVRFDDRKAVVTLDAALPDVLISIPLTEKITASEKDAALLFDRYVAIDLGEAGIGYAVFDARTHEKVASGHKLIPDIRNLIHRTRHYEQKPNQRQRFQQAFNVNLADLRENVAGNVCHHINRLCAYYRAFPVMEYMVPDKLNRQVKSVYEMVVNRYLWSSTSAHKAARTQFWLGGETWEHPYLKSAKDKKPITLAPGRGVSGKGTSQRCSCCGRNAFDLLAGLKDGDKVAVMNGRAVVGGHAFMLFEQARETEEDFKRRRREQRRPALSVPLSSGNYRVDELRSILRRNLRQAPSSKRTPDTTVSRYQCVFEDCRKAMHADENASINIGEKFSADLLTQEVPPA